MAKSKKPTVVDNGTGYDVDFNDEVGVIVLSYDQADTEDKAIEVAKGYHDEIAKQVKEEA